MSDEIYETVPITQESDTAGGNCDYMKYALYDTAEKSEPYRLAVQEKASLLPGPMTFILPAIYIGRLDKWAVSVPVGCDLEGMELVDNV